MLTHGHIEHSRHPIKKFDILENKSRITRLAEHWANSNPASPMFENAPLPQWSSLHQSFSDPCRKVKKYKDADALVSLLRLEHCSSFLSALHSLLPSVNIFSDSPEIFDQAAPATMGR